MIRVKLSYLFAASVPLQLLFLCGHLTLAYIYPKQVLAIEALPVVYLAATYAQWLIIAFAISWKTKQFRVPILMHLPHLLSFLPLVRHILLTSNRIATEPASLTLAWSHAVVTHCFSLIAAWLWQMREKEDTDPRELLRRDFIPLALYTTLALTIILLYAGIDFSFTTTVSPYAVGIIQLLLNLGVTAVLLHREHGGLKPLAIAAALFFSLANAALLFDKTPGDIGVELALAATSFTQIFCLFVFLMFSRHRAGAGGKD